MESSENPTQVEIKIVSPLPPRLIFKGQSYVQFEDPFLKQWETFGRIVFSVMQRELSRGMAPVIRIIIDEATLRGGK